MKTAMRKSHILHIHIHCALALVCIQLLFKTMCIFQSGKDIPTAVRISLTKMIAKDNDHVLNNTCDKYSAEKIPQQPIYDFGGGRKTVVNGECNMRYGKIENKPQRPTTLFKPNTSYYKTTVIPSEPTSSISNQVYSFSNTASYVTPTGDPQKRIWHQMKVTSNFLFFIELRID